MFLTQTNKEPQDILLTSEFRPKAYFLIQTTAPARQEFLRKAQSKFNKLSNTKKHGSNLAYVKQVHDLDRFRLWKKAA